MCIVYVCIFVFYKYNYKTNYKYIAITAHTIMFIFALSNTYRYIKIFFSALCVLCGTSVLLYVFMTDMYNTGMGIAAIVVSSVMMITGMFLAIDSGKIMAELREDIRTLGLINSSLKQSEYELKKDVNELNLQLTEYGKKFAENDLKYRKNNAEYKKTLDEQHDISEKLTIQNDAYKQQNDEFKQQIDTLRTQNVLMAAQFNEIKNNLDAQVAQLGAEVQQQRIYNNTLHANNDALKQNIDSLQQNNDTLQQNNDTLQKHNQELGTQIASLSALNKNMRVIIQTLAQTLDHSNELVGVIDSAVTKIQTAGEDVMSCALIMQKLTLGLRDLKFGEIDKNNDGFISLVEWADSLREAPISSK